MCNIDLKLSSLFNAKKSLSLNVLNTIFICMCVTTKCEQKEEKTENRGGNSVHIINELIARYLHGGSWIVG